MKGQEANVTDNPGGATRREIVERIARYLENNLDASITLSELSENFGISVSQIKYNFQMAYGMSVRDYICEYRMKKAEMLLVKTDRTVLDIAGELGYDNGSKFAAAFRRVRGMTPAEYRKNHFANRSQNSLFGVEEHKNKG